MRKDFDLDVISLKEDVMEKVKAEYALVIFTCVILISGSYMSNLGFFFSFHKQFMESGRFNKVWKKVCIEYQKCDIQVPFPLAKYTMVLFSSVPLWHLLCFFIDIFKVSLETHGLVMDYTFDTQSYYFNLFPFITLSNSQSVALHPVMKYHITHRVNNAESSFY